MPLLGAVVASGEVHSPIPTVAACCHLMLPNGLHIQPNWFPLAVPLVGITEIQGIQRQAEDDQAIPQLPK